MTASRVEGIIGMYVNQHSTAGQVVRKSTIMTKRGSLANQSYSHHRLLAGLQLNMNIKGNRKRRKEMTKEIDK